MTDHEKIWDASLRIQTCGRDALGADEYHHPYEPTPYSVLVRLADSGLVSKDDVVLDYGCGKGRVGFFLSYRKSVKSIGIEYDERIYQGALENQRFLPAPFTQGGLYATGRSYLRVDAFREEQRAMPVK